MSTETKDTYQDKRRAAIEDAAYSVLAEKGYKAASMLAIARKAKASNETLYNWYGNKQKLFESLVVANAQTVRMRLESSLEQPIDVSFAEMLESLGELLLKLVTGERAIALNRAAAGDVHDTATLGQTIASGGKDAILPLIDQFFEDARASGILNYQDDDQIAEIWISLLIGDLQIRRVIGVQPELAEQQFRARSQRAASLINRLFGA